MLIENSNDKVFCDIFIGSGQRRRGTSFDRNSRIAVGLIFIIVALVTDSSAQYSTSYITNPTIPNNFSNSRVFKQEIARFEVTVSRDGKPALPLTQVPRVEEGDILKVKLLEEAVGGTKPDQSNFDWTLSIAFINPSRNDNDPRSVTEEIRFRDKGWYKEHVFRVPYDSQPIIFLYTKPKYRNKISNLINKNPEDIRKLGEKTIEIAGAYAQISSFLSELQDVINRTGYDSNNIYGSSGYYGSGGSSYYGSGGSSYSGGSGTYNPYGINGSAPAFNNSRLAEQMVERAAKSFNIQLPQCWRQGNSYNSYGSYNSNGSYGTSGSYGSSYGGYYGITPQDLIGRMQCIAQSVRVEDLDISLSKMIQQGGVFAAAQIAQKYPQIAYWINLAAAAMDLIVKITRKASLKIVPTVVSSGESNSQYGSNNQPGYNSGYVAGQSPPSTYNQNYSPVNQSTQQTKISVYAENQPGDDKFVTAYPVIVQKWQAEPDPETLMISAPAPLESCLHVGQNILKNTNLSQDWLNDDFSRNFKLVLSSTSGFYKEFPLRKNAGLLGWDLNLLREDLATFPKIGMTIDAEITGTRGFTELKSPKFPLPVSTTAKWEVTAESQRNFTVGGKRRIGIINSLGNCLCLQAVIYKPSFGGQFVFEANGRENGLQSLPDEREVWFSVDATEFKSGQGTLDLVTYGGEKTTINLNAYPLFPQIEDIKISKGDREAVITGERLDQIQFILINGNRAKVIPGANPKERTVVFEDLYSKQTSEVVALELMLNEDRRYKVPETFKTSIARPMFVADNKEVDGDYIVADSASTALPVTRSDQPTGSASMDKSRNSKSVKQSALFRSERRQIDLSGLPVIPITATGISVRVRNALTDYDFKSENISIEVGIEKGEMLSDSFLQSEFEILDWKNIRLNLRFDEHLQKVIGGRRIQFRIKDKTRGNSDWYTIRQTFVRTPMIEKIVCAKDEKNGCELKGEGLDYIAQVSTDGGQTWFPSDASGLIAKVLPDGSKTATVPSPANNKQSLLIKLKDFPKTEGLIVNNYK